MQYRHSKGMGEISGFGGGYEACCQDMLEAGVNWILENPDKEPAYGGYKNVYGVCFEGNPDAEELTKVVMMLPKARLLELCIKR